MTRVHAIVSLATIPLLLAAAGLLLPGPAAQAPQAPAPPAPEAPAAPTSPAPEAAAKATAAPEFVPYDGLKDQFTIALPKGWYTFNQGAMFGKPGPFGVVVFSREQIGGTVPANDPEGAKKMGETMGRLDSGEIPSFFVDRHAAEKGMACDGFTDKGRKKILDIYKGSALGRDGKLVEDPEVEPVPVGGCQGLRVKMRVKRPNGDEWDFRIYAVSDGRTAYDFSLRNLKDFFDGNLPVFEKAISTLHIAKAR